MLRTQDCTYSAFFIPVTTVFNIPLTSWTWVTITDLVAGDSLKVPRAIPLQHGRPLRAQLVILCSQPLLFILRPLVRSRAPCQGASRYSSTFRRSILPLLLYRALLLQQHALAPSSLTPAPCCRSHHIHHGHSVDLLHRAGHRQQPAAGGGHGPQDGRGAIPDASMIQLW